MSEKKSPLAGILAGSVFMLIVLFVGFVVMGQVAFWLNPEDTPKVAKKYKCQNAYYSLKSAKGAAGPSTKWASAHYPLATKVHAACMAKKPFGSMIPKTKPSAKLVKVMKVMKEKAKKAKERLKNVQVGLKKTKKKKKKKSKGKELTAEEKLKKLKKKCDAVAQMAFVKSCTNG
jgi:hypothetical protein